MDRCGKEGVVIGVLKDGFRSYTSFRVWLLFEAEETVVEVERGSLKCGDWIFVFPSKDPSGYSRFKKIEPVLPTRVLEDDTVQVKTTAVFDMPNRAEPIQHNGFIVHSRYFGRVAAFVPFNDAIPRVPYEVFVERIPMNVTDLAVSWFIPQQSIIHPSCIPYTRENTQLGSLLGVVVSRCGNSAYVWTPILGEGICGDGGNLVNGDWVKFFVQARSLHEKNPNPNIHFRVARWERTDALLQSDKCRNSVELRSKVTVGDIARSLNGVMFADWVGPIEDRRGLLRRKVESMGPDHYSDKIEVLLERLKKSHEEPITIWSVKSVPEPPILVAEMSAPTSDTNAQSIFTAAPSSSNTYDGFSNDDEDEHHHTSFFNETSRRDHNWGYENEEHSSVDRFERPSAHTDFNTAMRQTCGANSPHLMDDERSAANTPGTSKNSKETEMEDAKLAEALRSLGKFFESANVRAAIKRNCPVDYLQLCQYYGYRP